MKLSIFRSSKVEGVDRRIVARFNKIMVEHIRNFRLQMGGVIADHAGRGFLLSGATIKACLASAEENLTTGVDECLQLVAKKTTHLGRNRKAMLAVLSDITSHRINQAGRIIEERFIKIDAFQGDAKVTADFEFQQASERVSDRIAAFADGLTAPPDEPWHKRHPYFSGAIVSLITLVLGLLVAQMGGILNL